jgi:hypothetical protein
VAGSDVLALAAEEAFQVEAGRLGHKGRSGGADGS